MADNIELNEIGRDNEGVDVEEGEQDETRLIERTRLLDGNEVDAGATTSNQLNSSAFFGYDQGIPDNTTSIPYEGLFNNNVELTNRQHTEYKKQFLRKELGIYLNKADGPFSTKLFDKISLRVNKGKTKILGVEYKGVNVIVTKGANEYEYSKSNGEKEKPIIAEFMELVEKAREEHAKTAVAPVEEYFSEEELYAPPGLVNSVVENSIENIEEEINYGLELITGKDMAISERALREIRGSLLTKETNAKVLEGLDTNAEYWTKLAKEKENEPEIEGERKLYETIAVTSMLRADEIRLKLGQRPKYKETLRIIREETDTNLLARFERFKKWAKENLLGISVVAISTAGIITTIAVAAKNTLKTGARATSAFGKR